MSLTPEWTDSSDNVYTALGVPCVINAATTRTSLGGSLMPETVVRAMAGAAEHFVGLSELHEVVGRRIAALTRNEAAHVTGGCAAAIALSVLAAMIRGRAELVARPPASDGLPVEVIVDRSHHVPYLPAIELVGGEIVTIGSQSGTRPEHLSEAISSRTAAVFWVEKPNFDGSAIPLELTIEIAHAEGVPVIVDAAAQLPPMHNLWRFTTDMGADLAVFSGGKGLRGPQSSGLIVGSANYVSACVANASPNTGLARAMKVGKEEIVGLLVALETYLESDEASSIELYHATCARWVAEVGRCPGLTASVENTNSSGQPTPRVRIELEIAETGIDAIEMQEQLWANVPRIAVQEDSLAVFYITPDTLKQGEVGLVAKAIVALLETARSDGEVIHRPQ
ncbi:MAG: aminotransferase class V-fold PLP-dependent enzyme [Acidimicrobiia bacterium]|nr:MAG: aminotransferase class V-fold PLP-dependent enzyme [Acidimicrobiia bacterium]